MVESWYEETNRSWGAVLAAAATRDPEREIIVHHERRLNRVDFHEQVQRFASGLLSLGVRHGDRVALWMSNCPEWMVAQFAVYAIGAALVPIHTRFAPPEVAYALEHADASTLIVQGHFLGEKIDTRPWLAELVPELFEGGARPFARFPRLEHVVFLGSQADRPRRAHDFDGVCARGHDWRADDALRYAELAVNPFDVANIVFTSGTTGFPKGGMSMHRNNMAALHHWIERTDLRPSDRMYLGVPFATNFGCAYVAQLSVLAGNTIVVDDAFTPGSALEAIAAERISWFPGAPTMYIMMLGQPQLEHYNLGSLRAAIVGGAPCPPQTIQQLKERMGFAYVIQAYGLSECAGLSTSTLIGDPLEKTATTVGKAFPSCRVQVADPSTGAALPPGEVGEVWLADACPGSCLGKGYYGDTAMTAASISPDGWFRTGDLGSLAADGYLSITGRLKDMYVVGGYNAYPAEIEAVLHAHPKIRMAQVVGVPEARLGEVGCLFVEARAGESLDSDEIVAFCAARMANYKVPRYVRVVAAADFPLTSSGKVKKHELRARAIAELGLTP